jgi:AraC-like DNA-binding protein
MKFYPDSGCRQRFVEGQNGDQEASHLASNPYIFDAKLRTPLEELAIVAQEDLDGLFDLVGPSGYGVFLCDTDGYIIKHRVWPIDTRSMHRENSSVRPHSTDDDRDGGRRDAIPKGWRECLYAGGISGTSPEVPVHDTTAGQLAVLRVASARPDRSGQLDTLLMAIIGAFARYIEERLFRRRFSMHWVVAIACLDMGGPAMLLAVDEFQRIVGADRNARLWLSQTVRDPDGTISLWAAFERNPVPFCCKEPGDIPFDLVPIGSSRDRPSLLTPPNAIRCRSAEARALHSRPRLHSIGELRQRASTPMARGGLSPTALRRVREYIDEHLEHKITLRDLARIAGLSLCHFSRSFKQSERVTPISYLGERRIELAQRLIVDTQLSLSEIALATGFCDQSNFSRQFRKFTGTSPSMFRVLERRAR